MAQFFINSRVSLSKHRDSSFMLDNASRVKVSTCHYTKKSSRQWVPVLQRTLLPIHVDLLIVILLSSTYLDRSPLGLNAANVNEYHETTHSVRMVITGKFEFKLTIDRERLVSTALDRSVRRVKAQSARFAGRQ